MFGLFKKRVHGKMEKLYQFSNVHVYNMLKVKGFKVNSKILDEESNGLWAAAVTNYLFGEGITDEHLKKISSEDIQMVGSQLLEESKNLRELVVQSLRVKSVIAYSETGDVNSVFGILEKYGHEFEESVNPSSYEFLVLKNIERMQKDKEIIVIGESKDSSWDEENTDDDSIFF